MGKGPQRGQTELRFEGEYKRHGQGTTAWPKGTTLEGEYENGVGVESLIRVATSFTMALVVTTSQFTISNRPVILGWT
jgi:hypothetical protein